MRSTHSWHKLTYAFTPETNGEGPWSSFEIAAVDVILDDDGRLKLWNHPSHKPAWRPVEDDERWRFAPDQETLVAQAAEHFDKDIAEASTHVRVLNHYLREALDDQARALTLRDGVLKHGIDQGILKTLEEAPCPA